MNNVLVIDLFPKCRAIKYVGGIIKDYDSDDKFKALGFGAKIPNRLSHNFPMNLDSGDEMVTGVRGIEKAYYKSLFDVVFWAPTYFAPIINHIARSAEAHQNILFTYHVLVIMTVRIYPS